MTQFRSDQLTVDGNARHAATLRSPGGCMALARGNALGTLLGRVLVIVLVGFTAMRS